MIPPRPLSSYDYLITKVSFDYDIPKATITGSDRQRRVVAARHLAMALIRKECHMSLAEVGTIFGVDHSSVRAACQKFSEAELDDFLRPFGK